MRSLASILYQIQRELGAQESKAPQSDDALVRSALEATRPDLLVFYKSVSRNGTTLTIEFSHPAAAQEATMVEKDLMASLSRIAGAKVAGRLRCKAGI
ncbi:MAG: hypothetical protein ABI743_15350 [bacterium]